MAAGNWSEAGVRVRKDGTVEPGHHWQVRVCRDGTYWLSVYKDEVRIAAGALKACRDAIAAWLGCDDGPRGPVRWHVDQESHKRYRLRPAVRVEILGPESEAGGQMVLR